MSNSILCLSLCFLITLQFNAQEMPSIQTDRPDQTESPFIVPIHYLQFETGFSYEKTNGEADEIVSPTVLSRFGINDYFELRMINEYIIGKVGSEKTTGINPVALGFKTLLFEEKGFIPVTSFMGHIAIPKLASKEYKTRYYAPDFRFTMQHTISKKQSLSYNLGAEWDGETLEPIFIYTLTTGYSFSDTLGVYMEVYGFLPQLEKADHRFDAGLTYLLNPNNQLDLSVGVGLSPMSPNYFLSFGYSLRFKT